MVLYKTNYSLLIKSDISFDMKDIVMKRLILFRQGTHNYQQSIMTLGLKSNIESCVFMLSCLNLLNFRKERDTLYVVNIIS